MFAGRYCCFPPRLRPHHQRLHPHPRGCGVLLLGQRRLSGRRHSGRSIRVDILVPRQRRSFAICLGFAVCWAECQYHGNAGGSGGQRGLYQLEDIGMSSQQLFIGKGRELIYSRSGDVSSLAS